MPWTLCYCSSVQSRSVESLFWVLFTGSLSTPLTSPRSLRVAWSLFSTTRPWSVTSQACLWLTPLCLMRELLLLRLCSSVTGIYMLTSLEKRAQLILNIVLWNYILATRMDQSVPPVVDSRCSVCIKPALQWSVIDICFSQTKQKKNLLRWPTLPSPDYCCSADQS